MTPEPRRLRIAAGIATTGRPQLLIETITDLMQQTRPLDKIVVCPATDEDFEGLLEAHPSVEIVRGERGLPRQRNCILKSLKEDNTDVVIFFDDDFIAAPDYVEQTEKLFLNHDSVAMATGKVLKDGILIGGIDLSEAREISRTPRGEDPAEEIRPIHGAYGCNMSIRLKPVFEADVFFDENLPLYAWLEDLDFSGQLRKSYPAGEIVHASSLRGVHIGHTSGRQPGLRLGYSQIVNPLYISRKGTFPKKHLYRLMARNVAANIIKMFHPKDKVDRIGRLKGNMKGLMDAMRGKDDPRNIEKMDKPRR